MIRNKYLIIEDSFTETNTSGLPYPDIMTFPINKFKTNSIPQKINVTQADINRFDILIYTYYGTSDYTDIILWYNNVASIHDLTAGDELIFPVPDDINRFYLENF